MLLLFLNSRRSDRFSINTHLKRQKYWIVFQQNKCTNSIRIRTARWVTNSSLTCSSPTSIDFFTILTVCSYTRNNSRSTTQQTASLLMLSINRTASDWTHLCSVKLQDVWTSVKQNCTKRWSPILRFSGVKRLNKLRRNILLSKLNSTTVLTRWEQKTTCLLGCHLTLSVSWGTSEFMEFSLVRWQVQA